MDGPKIRKASPVDRNHSHFIFVDNGTQQMFGTEIQFRAKLESAISEMKTDTGNSDEGTTSGCLFLNVFFFNFWRTHALFVEPLVPLF